MSIGASRLLISLLGTIFVTASVSQAQTISLDSLDQLKLVNVKAETVTFKGRKALRVIDAAKPGSGDEGRLVILPKTDFQDGVIEVDLAGEPGQGAAEGARGFVGVAFRVAADQSRFECIYLRPTNGRRGPGATEPFGPVHFGARVSVAFTSKRVPGKV